DSATARPSDTEECVQRGRTLCCVLKGLDDTRVRRLMRTRAQTRLKCFETGCTGQMGAIQIAISTGRFECLLGVATGKDELSSTGDGRPLVSKLADWLVIAVRRVDKTSV